MALEILGWLQFLNAYRKFVNRFSCHGLNVINTLNGFHIAMEYDLFVFIYLSKNINGTVSRKLFIAVAC